jgi:hypothetical protein
MIGAIVFRLADSVEVDDIGLAVFDFVKRGELKEIGKADALVEEIAMDVDVGEQGPDFNRKGKEMKFIDDEFGKRVFADFLK